MEHYEFIIIGAGPAGLQLGYFLEKQGVNYCILEGSHSPGHFYEKYPRHEKLISINKVYTGFEDPEVNLRWDWHSLLTDDSFRFTSYTEDYFPSRKIFYQYLQDFQQRYKLHILFQRKVNQISRNNDKFIVATENNELFTSKYLIVATGLFHINMPPIPGLENAMNYTNMPIDKKLFKNKRVLILGKGNSAFETADHLVDSACLIHLASPNPLQMAWRSHYVGHLRAVNNNILDTYQLKMLNAVINAKVTKIEESNDKFHVTFHYTLANDEIEMISYDYVINCMGFKFDTSIFAENCKPQLAINDRLPNLTNTYESTNINNLFFAGVIMQMRDFKKKQSGFVHGFRYNIKFLFHYLMSRHKKNTPLPHTHLKLLSREITSAIITEVNHTSALWQQTGYLCDLIVFNKESEQANFYKCLPVDFLRELPECQQNHYLVITLEFGQERIDEYQNVFAIDRIHKDDHGRAELSTGIHPIIKHYNTEGELLSTHHLIEDFDSVWNEPVHIKPLQLWLEQVMSALPVEEHA